MTLTAWRAVWHKAQADMDIGPVFVTQTNPSMKKIRYTSSQL